MYYSLYSLRYLTLKCTISMGITNMIPALVLQFDICNIDEELKQIYIYTRSITVGRRAHKTLEAISNISPHPSQKPSTSQKWDLYLHDTFISPGDYTRELVSFTLHIIFILSDVRQPQTMPSKVKYRNEPWSSNQGSH